MLEKVLVEYCAPTLAGIKPASMFTWKPVYLQGEKAVLAIDELNEKLTYRGISIKVLKKSSEKYLLLVYREKILKDLLKDERAKEILRERNYAVDLELENMLEDLSLRMKHIDDFPHEIGIFLGYPIDDVIAFIENKGKNCRYIGFWKVYKNELQDMRLFEKFIKCRELYARYFKKGWTVERLTVAA